MKYTSCLDDDRQSGFVLVVLLILIATSGAVVSLLLNEATRASGVTLDSLSYTQSALYAESITMLGQYKISSDVQRRDVDQCEDLKESFIVQNGYCELTVSCSVDNWPGLSDKIKIKGKAICGDKESDALREYSL